jgi:hypothetical protein
LAVPGTGGGTVFEGGREQTQDGDGHRPGASTCTLHPGVIRRTRCSARHRHRRFRLNCAGVTPNGGFKRLFPARFRHLSDHASSGRWDRVDVKCRPDRRSPSEKPSCDGRQHRG